MIRQTLLVVALSIVAASGCKKKNEADGQAGAAAVTEGEGPGSRGAGKAAATGAKGAQQWSKVDRVPFAKLQSLLPETLGSLKRSDLGGSMVPQDEYTHSQANAHYEGPKDASLTLTIEDNPVHAAEELPSKTSAFKGYPVVNESEGGGASDFRIVVGERFRVGVHGNELKVADLKAALEKVDLAKLASWKSEGVKK